MKIKISREEVLRASGELANDNLKEFVVFETEEEAIVVDEPIKVSAETTATPSLDQAAPAPSIQEENIATPEGAPTV